MRWLLPARGDRRRLRRPAGRLRRRGPGGAAHHQGRRRARPGGPVRRVRGHARRGDRGGAAAARPRRPARRGPSSGPFPRSLGFFRTGRGPEPAAADPAVSGLDRLPERSGGVEAPGHRRGAGRRCCWPGSDTPGVGRGRSVRDAATMTAAGARGRSSSPMTPRGRGAVRRQAVWPAPRSSLDRADRGRLLFPGPRCPRC